jgi:hypothetical protein
MRWFMLLPIIPITALCFILARIMANHFNRNIDEVRGVRRKFRKRRKTNKLWNAVNSNKVIKDNFSILESRLNRCGNPYHINAPIYYGIKLLSLFLLALYIIAYCSISVLVVALFSFIFFFIDISYFLINAVDNAAIKEDLPKVCNTMEIETYGGIPFDQALMDVFEVVKNRRFKKALFEMSAEIILKRNPSEALEHLKGKFKSDDIDSFVLTLQQGIETGKIRQMLESKSKTLTDMYVNSKDIQTSMNELKIFAVGLLDLIAISWLMFYVFYDYIASSLTLIF